MKEFKDNYFHKCNGKVWSIVLPLVEHLLPSEIDDIQIKKDYIKENFATLFLNEYQFKPYFTLENGKLVIEVCETSMKVNQFSQLPKSFAIIKTKLNSFNVIFEVEMKIK